MGILSWIVLGLVAGALAKWLMPGDDPGGILVTMLLGIGGALVGGYVATFLDLGSVRGFDLRSLAISVAGAFLLLFVYRRFRVHAHLREH